jgi:hypothetical protein
MTALAKALADAEERFIAKSFGLADKLERLVGSVTKLGQRLAPIESRPRAAPLVQRIFYVVSKTDDDITH